MSYTVVGSQTAWFAGGGANSVSYTPAAAGNYIVLMAGGGNAVGPFSAGTPYSLLTGGVAGGVIPQAITGAMYTFGLTTTSTSTITATVTGASGHDWGYLILEFSTGNSSWILDGSASNTYTGAASGAFPSITPAGTGRLWVGSGTLLNAANTTLSPIPAHTVNFQTQSGLVGFDAMFWQELASSSVYAPTVSSSTSAIQVTSSTLLYSPPGSQIVMVI